MLKCALNRVPCVSEDGDTTLRGGLRIYDRQPHFTETPICSHSLCVHAWGGPGERVETRVARASW